MNVARTYSDADNDFLLMAKTIKTVKETQTVRQIFGNEIPRCQYSVVVRFAVAIVTDITGKKKKENNE